MKEPGINGSHSAKSVSISKCKISRLSFKEIAKSAGWSNEETFAEFYDRPIQKDFLNYSCRLNFLFKEFKLTFTRKCYFNF